MKYLHYLKQKHIHNICSYLLSTYMCVYAPISNHLIIKHNLPIAIMFSQVISTEIVQHFIALLSTTESCTDPSDSFALNNDLVKATVTSTKVKHHNKQISIYVMSTKCKK